MGIFKESFNTLEGGTVEAWFNEHQTIRKAKEKFPVLIHAYHFVLYGR